MQCPRCGYEIDTLTGECRVCAQAGEQAAGRAQWEQQTVAWLCANTGATAEQAREALVRTGWDAYAAAALWAPPPQPPAASAPAPRNRTLLIVILIVLLAMFGGATVSWQARLAQQRAQDQIKGLPQPLEFPEWGPAIPTPSPGQCIICGGTGRMDCPFCTGGQTPDPRTGRPVQCQACQGTGSRECPACRGTGKFGGPTPPGPPSPGTRPPGSPP